MVSCAGSFYSHRDPLNARDIADQTKANVQQLEVQLESQARHFMAIDESEEDCRDRSMELFVTVAEKRLQEMQPRAELAKHKTGLLKGMLITVGGVCCAGGAELAIPHNPLRLAIMVAGALTGLIGMGLNIYHVVGGFKAEHKVDQLQKQSDKSSDECLSSFDRADQLASQKVAAAEALLATQQTIKTERDNLQVLEMVDAVATPPSGRDKVTRESDTLFIGPIRVPVKPGG